MALKKGSRREPFLKAQTTKASQREAFTVLAFLSKHQHSCCIQTIAMIAIYSSCLLRFTLTMYTLSNNAAGAQDIKTNISASHQPKQLDTCLKFAIDPQTIGLLESASVQEVLTVNSTHILPVPNKPSCILGIIARRRRVYWAIDLAMLLGLQPLDQDITLYEIVIISAQSLSLALVVPSILGVVHIQGDRLEHDVVLMPATLKPYLKGYINKDEKISYLLRPENILRSTILHS